MTPKTTFEIGLSAWIIQDGNYPDFEVGQAYRFALEVGPEGLIRGTDPLKSLTRLSEAQYAFDGEVVIHEPGLSILDVGLLCYHDGALADGLQAGAFISGDLYLGVDPFFWSETHSLRSDVPDLIYHWQVRQILLETTPWRDELDSSGQAFRIRSEGPRSFSPVKRTRAWEDDGGNAHYILICERLGPDGP